MIENVSYKRQWLTLVKRGEIIKRKGKFKNIILLIFGEIII